MKKFIAITIATIMTATTVMAKPLPDNSPYFNGKYEGKEWTKKIRNNVRGGEVDAMSYVAPGYDSTMGYYTKIVSDMFTTSNYYVGNTPAYPKTFFPTLDSWNKVEPVNKKKVANKKDLIKIAGTTLVDYKENTIPIDVYRSKDGVLLIEVEKVLKALSDSKTKMVDRSPGETEERDADSDKTLNRNQAGYLKYKKVGDRYQILPSRFGLAAQVQLIPNATYVRTDMPTLYSAAQLNGKSLTQPTGWDLTTFQNLYYPSGGSFSVSTLKKQPNVNDYYWTPIIDGKMFANMGLLSDLSLGRGNVYWLGKELHTEYMAGDEEDGILPPGYTYEDRIGTIRRDEETGTVYRTIRRRDLGTNVRNDDFTDAKGKLWFDLYPEEQRTTTGIVAEGEETTPFMKRSSYSGLKYDEIWLHPELALRDNTGYVTKEQKDFIVDSQTGRAVK